jgi:hypothetical protein
MVEAAIVTPLLLLLVFGIIEFGFLYKDALTVANGSRAGARVGSAAGADPLADFQVLQAVEGATGTLAHVQLVVVFKASSPTGAVPPACLAGTGIAGLCNVYNAVDLTNDQAAFVASGKQTAWDSTTRQTSLSAPGGPDYLGIYVQARHNSVLHLIVPDRDLSDTVVMRLEPTR